MILRDFELSCLVLLGNFVLRISFDFVRCSMIIYDFARCNTIFVEIS